MRGAVVRVDLDSPFDARPGAGQSGGLPGCRVVMLGALVLAVPGADVVVAAGGAEVDTAAVVVVEGDPPPAAFESSTS